MPKKSKAWVDKKLRSGVSLDVLYNCVGIFSSRDPKKVMKEKNLNKKQYEKRYYFLYDAFCYMENLKGKRK